VKYFSSSAAVKDTFYMFFFNNLFKKLTCPIHFFFNVHAITQQTQQNIKNQLKRWLKLREKYNK